MDVSHIGLKHKPAVVRRNKFIERCMPLNKFVASGVPQIERYGSYFLM